MATLWTRQTHRLKQLRQLVTDPVALSVAERTPFTVLAQEEIVTLRFYAPAQATRQPVVIVPPLAVNMRIYDLFPERSLVAWLRDQGHPVYLIDWGRPTRAQAHYRFETYLNRFLPQMLDRVRAHAGTQRLALHGWSLGAVLSYCYVAQGDSDIDRLVLLGPPCDYHAGAGGAQNRLIARQVRRIERLAGRHVHQSRREWWHVPGWMNALGFKLMSPGGTLKGYQALLRHLDDPEFVTAHATNASFLDDMVAYPGGVVQDMLRYLITDNVLAEGRLPVRHSTARLHQVRCPVLVVVGDQDPIVTPEASRRLIALMPEADCTLIEVPGGHMSIVSGSAAPQRIWPHVGAFLAG